MQMVACIARTQGRYRIGIVHYGTRGKCDHILKMFFSEEKNQKTFISCACGKIQAMASIVKPAQK
jgi:hypothetical protein